MKLFLIAAMVVNFVSMASGSSIIFSNTGTPSATLDINANTTLLATEFHSPSIPTVITSVTLMGNGNSVGSPVFLSVALHADSPGAPGGFLGVLGAATFNNDGVNTNYVFTPPSGVLLAASTNYWLVLGCANCTAPTDGGWAITDSPTFSGLPGAADPNVKLISFNSGTNYVSPAAPQPFIVTVSGNPVPEPGTFIPFAGLAIAGMWALYRQRR